MQQSSRASRSLIDLYVYVYVYMSVGAVHRCGSWERTSAAMVGAPATAGVEAFRGLEGV